MSWFSKPNTDKTGSVSTVKDVGKFKGMIKVTNGGDEILYKEQKKARIDLTKQLIREIVEAKNNEVMAFDWDKLGT